MNSVTIVTECPVDALGGFNGYRCVGIEKNILDA